MYIEKLTIKNVKLIRDQTISFLRDDKPRMWTVIVGENGLCKTTILQAIALAAVGQDAANKLADGQSFGDRRIEGPAVILAEFGFGATHHSDGKREYPGMKQRPEHSPKVRSEIITGRGLDFFLGRSSYPGYPLDQLENRSDDLMGPSLGPIRMARGKRLPYWLVAGYGTTRSLPVPKSIEKPSNAVVERLTSLFEARQIVGTGFADLFTGKLVNDYARVLKHALLDQNQVLPLVTKLELRGKAGIRSASHLVESHRFSFKTVGEPIKVPATWLSQGYQAMIAWIADVVGQFFWDEDGEVDLDKMEGLVLIDEIDIHLHPSWQLGLITALKKVFPRVQFVATTHTAMVLPGLEADEVLRTRLDEEGNVVVEPVGQSPSLMTGSEIFSTFFGIKSLYPEEVGEALLRYGYLASDSTRSDEEEAELQRILALLEKEGVEPGWEPKPRNGRPKSRKGTKRPPRK